MVSLSVYIVERRDLADFSLNGLSVSAIFGKSIKDRAKRFAAFDSAHQTLPKTTISSHLEKLGFATVPDTEWYHLVLNVDDSA